MRACVDGGLPTARCVEAWLACGAVDGCCAPGCSSGTDADCPVGARTWNPGTATEGACN